MAFKNFGHQVEAIDFSEELVEKARQLTELPVQFGSFYELAEVAKYNGMWACASLLHCERPRLKEVIGKLVNVLKPKGVLYMSFKYGDWDIPA